MWARLALAACWLVAAGCPRLAAAQDRSLEYSVKGAFLYKFGSFVEWPPGAFAAPHSPVQLCIIGRDPFGQPLDAIVQGQTINMRPIVVRRLPTISASSGCHIAYLGGSPVQSVSSALRAVAESPVLTVAEAAPGDRAAIQFVLRANRVRFRIDERAASDAGVGISSKLLNLAIEVAR